jgi:hypothetical protein
MTGDPFLDMLGLRQPRPPKPHVMLSRGRWYLVDPWPGWGTWQQSAPITSDPRIAMLP